jgi:hypothetical protein
MSSGFSSQNLQNNQINYNRNINIPPLSPNINSTPLSPKFSLK